MNFFFPKTSSENWGELANMLNKNCFFLNSFTIYNFYATQIGIKFRREKE
jgi:hypothetical protein